MFNVQKIDRIEFNRVMKRRRIRTYLIVNFVMILFICIVSAKCYQYAINKSYSKYLINMDAGNVDIKSLQEKRENYEKTMNIEYIDYKIDEDIEKSNRPKSLIIHHTAVDKLTPEQINEDHKRKGYGGIGYHFYIRRDGTIYKGRDEEYVGAHTIGRNRDSIGICLEGNFQEDELPSEEEKSLVMLCADMIIKYNMIDIIGHKDAYQTLCPGKNISISELQEKVKEEIINISKE